MPVCGAQESMLVRSPVDRMRLDHAGCDPLVPETHCSHIRP